MDSDFGERQFESVLNIELTTTLGPMMAPAGPVVPTTNEEAEGGWDALYKLGTGYWYYLQYKVVTAASRRTGRNTKLWDFHRGPYLRFPLHRNSKGECRQHRLLSELRSERPGVYYCIPSFVEEEELWERVASGTVFDGVRLIDLADVPLRSHSGSHQISYDETGLVRPWSEPGEASVGDRSANVRYAPPNRQEMSVEAVADLFVGAASIAGRAARERPGRSFEAWLASRVPEPAQDLVRQMGGEADREASARRVADSLDRGELTAATARVLRLDFGLTWVIEAGWSPT